MYIEPNSDARTLATTYRQFYNAFLEKGFTEEQSMEMIKTLILGSMQGMNGNGS